MATLGRYCLILFVWLMAGSALAQHQRVTSLFSTFAMTNNGHLTFSNKTVAVTAPPAGKLTLFASNNTVYILTSAGALIDLTATGALALQVNPGQLGWNGTTLWITNAPKITNIANWFATDGTAANATNQGFGWTAVSIGGDAWPTMRFPTRYAGNDIDFVSFRSDSSASVSNILYFGNQNDGKIFAMDWKLGGLEWGNSDPRYVWNFSGNEGGLVTEQVGMYFQQHGTHGGRIQLYTPDTFGGMYAIEVTNTTMRLGNLTYLVEIAGVPIQFKGNVVGDGWYRGLGGFTNDSGDYFHVGPVASPAFVVWPSSPRIDSLVAHYFGGEITATQAVTLLSTLTVTGAATNKAGLTAQTINATAVVITNNVSYLSANLAPTGNATNFQADYTFAWRTVLMTNACRFTGVVNVAAADVGKAYIAKFRNTSGAALRLSVDAGFRRSGTNDVSVGNNQNADVLITPDGTGGSNPTNHTAQIILYDSP